jgi:protein-tyrosine-phosphatase
MVTGQPTPTVLFVCEHGSAKSVVAAAHFNRLAAQQGVPLHAISRGTDPDPENHPAAVAGLAGDALQPAARPRRLAIADLDGAAAVVAFSPLPASYASHAPVRVWNVPAVSEGYGRARDEIVARVRELLAELAGR